MDWLKRFIGKQTTAEHEPQPEQAAQPTPLLPVEPQ